MLLAEVKALLGITVTTNDAQITALIPVIEDLVRTICNDPFVTFPAAVQGVIAEMIQYKLSGPRHGVTSVKLGDAQESYASDTTVQGFPLSIIDQLPRKVQFV